MLTEILVETCLPVTSRFVAAAITAAFATTASGRTLLVREIVGS